MSRNRTEFDTPHPAGLVALALTEATAAETGTLFTRVRRMRDWLKSHEPQIAPYIFLAAISVAEFVTATASPRTGVLLHGLVLMALVLYGAVMPDEAPRRLLWTLILAPLIRIMSLSLPLGQFPIFSWYFVISLPLFATGLLLSRILGFPRSDLGLRVAWRNVPGDLLVIGVGLPLGFVEYSILRPDPLVSLQGWILPVMAALILGVSTGFSEEFMFRGLMQSAATPVIRRWSPLFVNLMFAVLHMGYQSFIDLVFVFIVGMFFSWYTLRSRSIFAVTLCHSFVNITLFLIAPFLFPNVPPAPVILP